MITNCTITSIASPLVGPTGKSSFTASSPALAIRCVQSAPTRRQKFQLGATINDATAVVRIEEVNLKMAGISEIAPGYQVIAALDGESEKTYVVIHVIKTIHPPVSNRAVFLQETT